MDVFDLQATISINIDDFIDSINHAASTAREFSENFSRNTRGITDGEESIRDYEETLSQLRRQLSQVAQEQTETAHRADSLRRAYEESVEATGENSEESQRLASELEEVEEQSRQLQVRSNQLSNQITETTNEMENLGDESEDAGKSTNNLSKLFETLKKASGTAWNGVKSLAEHLKNGFVNASKLALTGVKNLAIGLKDTLVKAVTASVQAIGKIGNGFISLAKNSIDVGKSFEKSMSQVAATMGITADTIDEDGTKPFEILQKAASDAGENTMYSASQAADALNYLALAGYDAAKASEALPSVLNLAQAGGLDLAYASDLATDAMAALGIEATKTNLDKFGDQLAKTASKSNTSVGQLGEAILTVGGTAKSLAGGTTELNAALGVLANRGIKGAEGGTALRNIILSLSAPTDKAAQQLEALGVAAYDDSGKMRPLNDTFADLNNALANMTEGQKTEALNEIFNKVDLKSAQALLAGTGKEFDDLAYEIDNAAGAMGDMANTMAQNLDGALKSLSSKAEAFGITFYDSVKSPLTSLVNEAGGYVQRLNTALKEGGFDALALEIGDVLADAVNTISGYIPKIIQIASKIIKSLITGISERSGEIIATAVEIGKVLIQGLGESIVSFFGFGSQIIGELANGIVSAVPDIITALGNITTAFLDGMTNVIPQLINVVKLIVSNLIEGFVTEGAKIGESLSGLVDSIIKAFDSLAPYILNAVLTLLDIITSPDVLSSASDMIFSIIESIANFISAAIPMISKKLPQIIKNIIQFFKKAIPEFLRMVKDIINNLIPAILEAIPDLLQAISEIIDELTTSILGYIPQFISIGIQIFTALVGALPDIIINILNVIPDIISSILTALTDNLPMIIQSGLVLFSALVSALPEIIINIVSVLPEIISGIIDAIQDNIPLIIQAGIDLFISLIDALPEILETLSDAIPEIVEAILDAIAIALPAIIDVGFDLFTALIDNLPEIISSITKQIPTIVKAIADTIAGLVYEMVEAGANLIRGLWDGIMSVQDWFMNKVSEFCDDWIQGFKDLFGIASPSKVMRDEIGTFLAMGVGVGFSDEMDNVSKDSEKAMKSAFENLGDFDIAAPAMKAFDTSQITEALKQIDDVKFNADTSRITETLKQIEYIKIQVDTSELEKVLDNLTGTAEITPNIIENNAEYEATIAASDKSAGGVIIKNITVNMNGMKLESDYDVEKLSDRFVRLLNEKLAMLEVSDKRAYGGTGW